LDYAYFTTAAGGSPILYARKKDQKPYPDYIQLGQAGNTLTRAENDISLIWLTKDDGDTAKYGNQINIDKSTQGYYEYTVLQLLGGQFYQFYKANMYDVRIVCIDSRIEDILKEIENSEMTPIDENFKTTARNFDLQPTVVVGEDNVTVSLVLFTKWGGFIRATFTMNHDYPHSVTKYETQSLLAYDSGIKM
jgi:hypothetical protein